MDNVLDVENNYQHALEIAANLTQVNLATSTEATAACLRVITMHPCFMTGYDTGDEVGVVSGFLFAFSADRNAMHFLVVAQQSWHKSR